MRPSKILLSQWQNPWLLGLRLASLQKLARATGIPSTGTRKVLVERIGTALDIQAAGRKSHVEFENSAAAKSLSVLSIDMGIKNLAFAHLWVDKPFHGLGVGSTAGAGVGGGVRPEVRAWRRLSLEDIGGLKDGESSLVSTAVPSTESSEEADADLEIEKKDTSFDLSHYASTAHTLLNTLVATYKPTHILIERQRFRSGSSSHVQEWTLRVGLFEAMLYAALEAMKKERGGNLADVGVYGIDPKRVVQYWGEKVDGFTKVKSGDGHGDGDKDTTRRPTSREVKKAKIEIVAKWLESELSGSGADAGTADPTRKIDISQSASVKDLAEAYLARLRTPAKRGLTNRGRPRVETVANDVIKLDDLADCLLQGVTWIEWIRMRELVLRKGLTMLEG